MINEQENLKNIIKEGILEALTSLPAEKITLTIAECSEYTGIGRDKLMELAHSSNSDFPYFKVGSKFLINKQLLIKWLDTITKERRIL